MDKENKLCDIQECDENKCNTIFNTPVRFGKERNINLKKSEFERHRPYKNYSTTPSPKVRAIKNACEHSTPSPKQRAFFNPFEAGLRKCLHLSVLSPSVFTKVISPSQDPTFWRIEDVSMLKPVAIEENPVEQFEHFESETNDDDDIQEAIKSYFLTSQIVPSPCEPLPKVENDHLLHFQKQDEKYKTENSDLNDSLKDIKNSSSQTELTLPPVLPSELEKALKPYLTYNQDQQDCEEVSLNSSSLRRKLLFGQFEECENMSVCSDEKQETPLKSGRMITPVRFSSFRHFQGLESSPKEGFTKRTYGSPLPGELSPETSPIIFRNENRMLMNSTGASCSTSIIRTLDFEEDNLLCDELRAKMKKSNDSDMSIVVQENIVQDSEPMNMTGFAVSNNAVPSVSYEGGLSHNFLSTQMQSQDTGYSSISNSIQQGHIESTDLTWKISSNIFSSTPTK